MQVRGSLAAIVMTLVCADAVRADVFTVMVDAVEHTVREDYLARVSLPSGAVDVTIMTSGTATYGQGSYGSLMVEHKDGAVSVQRAVPIGGSIHFSITNSLSYPLQFYFVDQDPSDNTGAITVSVSGTVNASLAVSPSLNCLTDTHAATITLTNAFYMVAATGAPQFGWGAFGTVTIMYDDPTGVRYFQEVWMGAGAAWVSPFEGGVVKLFFANTGGYAGGSGNAQVVFSEIGPVRTEARTWGSVKAVYMR